MMYSKVTLPLYFVCLLFHLSCVEKEVGNTSGVQESSKTIFERIDSSESNLVFSNSIQENVSTLENLFNYDYFYNGAGVGIEDLNNDGLLDIFFCGNQVPNKLYLNKGNLIFEDVSKRAGINTNKIWANGVTFVDINDDGWMDIYISQGGPNKRLQRKNLFYINQKDGTFLESAERYGLADMGISTQSVFFDGDNDGDLDCLVMNENEYYGVDPISLKKMVAQNSESEYFNSSHFYRNEGGTFVDETKKSGIQRPIFGLGISVSDINNDGWMDFYMASDYYLPDVLFINNQDGTFSDKIKAYTNQISYYGMGMDIADINNDNQQDIFVLDMASSDHIRSKTLMASMNTKRFDYLVNTAQYHHQYMYNSLQLATDGNKFSNVVQSTGMANSDWSWSVILSDLDHDEDKDVYITNGYRRYALDNDLQRKVYEAKVKYNNKVPLEIKKQLYESMPTEKLPNILYQNDGDLKFKEAANDWGLADFSFSNGAALGDLDNDGDLDLVVNNMDENCFLYRNNTVENEKGNFLKVKPKGNLSESFPKVEINYGEKSQMVEIRRVRGYRSSHEHVAHFGLGTVNSIDRVSIFWPDGTSEIKYNIPANTIIIFDKKDAKLNAILPKKKDGPIFLKTDPITLGIDFKHQENVYDDFEKEILLPYKQSTFGPYFSQGDLNGDGLEDFFIGGASGQAGATYFQNTSGNYYKAAQPALENDRIHEDMESIIVDFDSDGDQDLFVVSGGNEFEPQSSYYADRLYLNDGAGNLIKKESKTLAKSRKSGKSITAIDFDQDGDQDILVGNRIVPKNYPNPAPSTLYENRNGELIDVTHKTVIGLSDFGIVNRIIATDFDKDGWQDFIAVGEWTDIGFFKNEKGIFKKVTDQNKIPQLKGWWFSVSETDVNNDGLPDYILGNVGTNIKFDASEKKPFKVFASDFDENGSSDIVLSKEYNGEYVPVRGRECSSQQMPFIQQKFETYSEFANAKLVDIYGEKLASAYEGEVTEFKSVVLLNKGGGQFEAVYLPNEAQHFPVFDTVFMDVNGDGFQDAILAGNIYDTEVETPRLDAITGLVLLSNGKNGYTPMSWGHSGLALDGNIKDLVILKNQNGIKLLATQNNGSIILNTLN